MTYLKRKIDETLRQWKADPKRKPLIVKGPRQIGKTESVHHFAEANYTSVIYISFVEEPKYKLITEDGYKTDDIIKNISRMDPAKRFIPGETLIFFAKGYEADFVEDIYQHMAQMKPFNEVLLKTCHNLFLDYCILGGMPAVVKEYIEKGTFEGTQEIQKQLILDYKEDIRKYADGVDQTRILNIFNQIPVQLAKENKKFQISKVASGARFKDYRGCIEWLNDAGIINICYCLHFPELPLRGNYDDTKMKVYFADSGLLVALLDEEAQEDLRANKNLGVYKGALYENVVGEALVKSGYELYYYKREDSTLEEDFFVRTASELIPVEVKAKSGKAKSMQALIENDRYPEIHHGIKLTGGNIGFSDNVYTFPYFCTFLMKRYLKSDPFSGSEER